MDFTDDDDFDSLGEVHQHHHLPDHFAVDANIMVPGQDFRAGENNAAAEEERLRGQQAVAQFQAPAPPQAHAAPLPPPPAAYQLQVAEPIRVVGQPSPAGGQEPRSWTLQIPRPMAGGEDVTVLVRMKVSQQDSKHRSVVNPGNPIVAVLTVARSPGIRDDHRSRLQEVNDLELAYHGLAPADWERYFVVGHFVTQVPDSGSAKIYVVQLQLTADRASLINTAASGRDLANVHVAVLRNIEPDARFMDSSPCVKSRCELVRYQPQHLPHQLFNGHAGALPEVPVGEENDELYGGGANPEANAAVNANGAAAAAAAAMNSGAHRGATGSGHAGIGSTNAFLGSVASSVASPWQFTDLTNTVHSSKRARCHTPREAAFHSPQTPAAAAAAMTTAAAAAAVAASTPMVQEPQDAQKARRPGESLFVVGVYAHSEAQLRDALAPQFEVQSVRRKSSSGDEQGP